MRFWLPLAGLALLLAVSEAQDAATTAAPVGPTATCDMIDSCNDCDDPDFLCLECADKYVKKKDGSECVRCPTNCDSCRLNGDVSECDECSIQYFKVEGQCDWCVGHCDSCKDTTSCDKCSAFFRKVESEIVCQGCPPNCVDCTDTSRCRKCADSWYLSGSTCVPCATKCKLCKNGDSCDECSAGNTWNGAKKICESCIANCDTCTTSGGCTKCVGGYSLSSDKSECLSCANCETCPENGGCPKCNVAYILDYKKECQGCPSFTSTTCPTCKAETNGRFWDASANECLYCEENCMICTSDTNCLSCVGDFYISGGDCLECPANCDNCGPINACTACKEGFYWDTTECKSCDSTCKICAATATTCFSCPSGSYLDGTTCTTCPGDLNDQNTAVSCSQCSDGQKYHVAGCIPCSSDCAVCEFTDATNTATTCTKCDNMFYLTSTFTCDDCDTTCGTRCSGPDADECYDCPTVDILTEVAGGAGTCGTDPSIAASFKASQGWPIVGCTAVNKYFDGTTCADCDALCISCVDSAATDCLACAHGNYFVDTDDDGIGTCIACAGTCETCNGAGASACTSCDVGEFLNDGGTGAGTCDDCDGTVCNIAYRCTAATECDVCDTGYGKLAGTNTCVLVAGGDATSCAGTVKHAFWVSGTTTCTACTGDCVVCSDGTTCTECPYDTFVVTATGCLVGSACGSDEFNDAGTDIGSCTGDCTTNCGTASTCKTATECLTCDSSEALFAFFRRTAGTYTGTCGTPNAFCAGLGAGDDKCLECTETACTKCTNNYFLSGGVCTSCDDNNCWHCHGTTGACVATKCFRGYDYVAASKTCVCSDACKTCYDTSTPGCEGCNTDCMVTCTGTAGTCTTKDGTAFTCPAGCDQCSAAGCIKCAGTNYVSAAGTCEPCGSNDDKNTCNVACAAFVWRLPCLETIITNCKTSGTTGVSGAAYTATCNTCEDGYWPDSGSCTQCTQSNCLTCSNAADTSCTKCADGYYRTGGECVKCDLGCSACTKTDSCTACETGLMLSSGGVCVDCNYNEIQCPNCGTLNRGNYYISDTSSCRRCSTNCKYCTNDVTCTECATNYFLDESVPAAITCKSCNTVKGGTNQDGCSKCMDEFMPPLVWDADTTTCKVCPNNCKKCGAIDTCTECYTGYFWDSVNTACSKCISNCDTCGTSTGCTKCRTGFYYTSTLTCSACSGISNCDDCTHAGCQSCYTGFYLKDGACPSCSTDVATGCLACNDATTCKNCGPKKFFDAADPKSCADCITGCTTCADSTTCLVCDSGYCLNPDTNLCVQTSTNCATCTEDAGKVTCQTCISRHFLEICQACTKSGCIKCDAERDVCEECMDPLYLEDGSCKACPDFFRCRDCSSSRAEKCDDCGSYRFWDAVSSTCAACPANCPKCNDKDTCSSCRCAGCDSEDCDDYYYCRYRSFFWHKDSSTCKACMTGCSECSNPGDTCGKCFDHYYQLPVEGDITSCESCPSGCERCHTVVDAEDAITVVCDDCMVGYFRTTKDVCESCSSAFSGCALCEDTDANDKIDAGECEVCAYPYGTLKDDKSECLMCKDVSSGCTECVDYPYLCRDCAEGNVATEDLEQCMPGCYSCLDDTCPREGDANETVVACPDLGTTNACWYARLTDANDVATYKRMCLNETCSEDPDWECTKADGVEECKKCCTEDRCNQSGAMALLGDVRVLFAAVSVIIMAVARTFNM